MWFILILATTLFAQYSHAQHSPVEDKNGKIQALFPKPQKVWLSVNVNAFEDEDHEAWRISVGKKTPWHLELATSPQESFKKKPLSQDNLLVLALKSLQLGLSNEENLEPRTANSLSYLRKIKSLCETELLIKETPHMGPETFPDSPMPQQRRRGLSEGDVCTFIHHHVPKDADEHKAKPPTPTRAVSAPPRSLAHRRATPYPSMLSLEQAEITFTSATIQTTSVARRLSTDSPSMPTTPIPPSPVFSTQALSTPLLISASIAAASELQ